MNHFRTAHPKEYQERCVRPTTLPPESEFALRVELANAKQKPPKKLSEAEASAQFVRNHKAIMGEVAEPDPDPAYPCGCGEVHRRSERCGPW